MARKNEDDRGTQKGGQRHAEGGHGDRTHAALKDQLEGGPSGAQRRNPEAAGDPTHSDRGKDRLFESREQHDDVERESEKNRLARDIERHGHDRERFQVPGGKERHPAAPRDDDSAIGPRKD